MQKRVLGKTGEQLSIIGFSGVICSTGNDYTGKGNLADQSDVNAFVREAIDRGVNWFDVGQPYGNAEERLGPALKEFRKDVFLASKTDKLDKEGAATVLRESLKTMQTDYFDLYQFIHMDKEEDLQKAMGPGGAIEAFVEAREEGLVRYLGFSSHRVEVALAAMDQFDFDSVMFPINWVCCFNGNFGPQVIAKAKEKGMGCLAIKAMARTPWRGQDDLRGGEYPKCWYQPVTDPEETDLAVRFTLSEPITAAVPTAHKRLVRRALDIADEFQPLTDAEREMLRQRAVGLKPMFTSAK